MLFRALFLAQCVFTWLNVVYAAGIIGKNILYMNAMRYHEPLKLLEVIIEFYFTCPKPNQGTNTFQ